VAPGLFIIVDDLADANVQVGCDICGFAIEPSVFGVLSSHCIDFPFCLPFLLMATLWGGEGG